MIDSNTAHFWNSPIKHVLYIYFRNIRRITKQPLYKGRPTQRLPIGPTWNACHYAAISVHERPDATSC